MLSERRDSLFRYYEELVLDSIAGKPVSVVAEFEERMTPEASARATILHDHFSRYQIRGDPDVASAIYLSGSDNVLWSTNSVYIMNIRQQMKQMFGWLANDDAMRFTWRIPASLQEDSDIKAGVSSDTP